MIINGVEYRTFMTQHTISNTKVMRERKKKQEKQSILTESIEVLTVLQSHKSC